MWSFAVFIFKLAAILNVLLTVFPPIYYLFPYYLITMFVCVHASVQ